MTNSVKEERDARKDGRALHESSDLMKYPKQEGPFDHTRRQCKPSCLFYWGIDAREEEVILPDPRSATQHDQKEVADRLYDNLEADQTRLLALQPGKLNESLKGQHLVVNLKKDSSSPAALLPDGSAQIPYEAVSYAWGLPRYTQTIELDAIDYPITENLYLALQRLRRENRVRHLWIDALCINQHDFEERAAQIANMLTTFQSARQVVVWLGDHGPFTTLAMRSLSRNSAICKSHSTAAKAGLEDIFARPWFCRLWVRQEVWIAYDISVICGKAAIHWHLLKKRTGHAVFGGLRTRDLEEPFGELVQSASHHQRGGDLLDTIWRSRNCRVTLLHDIVYGVLAMTNTRYQAAAPSDGSNCIIVDYRKHITEVFVDVARYIISRDRSLQILHLDASLGGEILGHQLPSWVPDLRTLGNSRYRKAYASQHGPSLPVPESVAPQVVKVAAMGDALHVFGNQIGYVEQTDSTGCDVKWAKPFQQHIQQRCAYDCCKEDLDLHPWTHRLLHDDSPRVEPLEGDILVCAFGCGIEYQPPQPIFLLLRRRKAATSSPLFSFVDTVWHRRIHSGLQQHDEALGDRSQEYLHQCLGDSTLQTFTIV